MADPIIIRPEAATIVIGGRPFSNFPKAGAIFATATTTANSTSTEGLNDTLVHVRTSTTLRTATLTLIQHSADDIFMQASVAALLASNSVLPLAVKWGAVDMVSGSVDISQEPERTLSGDANENAVWTMTGKFTIFKLLTIATPEVLTAEQITSFI